MIDFLSTVGDFLMAPLYYVVSLIMVGFHTLISTFLDPSSGLSWALAIVGLTLVVRGALIPLFVKQIRSARNVQLLQPKIRELQKTHGQDREKLAQELMTLYKTTNTNPFAYMLPLLVQIPVFLALFRMLDLASEGKPRGILSLEEASQFGSAELFSIPIAGSLLNPGVGGLSVQMLAAALVIVMGFTTFATQKRTMRRNVPAEALNGPYARQQKLLLYILPPLFAVGAIAFPIGVLVYWTTTNVWTMFQQFYIIRRAPAPNTLAFEAKQKREQKKVS